MADAHGSDTRPGSNQDAARLKPVHQRHGAIENLGWRLVHDGGWSHVQPPGHIAGHADNLGGSRLIVRTQSGTDDDGLPDGIGIRPVLARHGLADDHGSTRLLVEPWSSAK